MNHMEEMWDFSVMEDVSFLNANRNLDFLPAKRDPKEPAPGLKDASMREKLLRCLPESRRECSNLDLNCYYLMLRKRIKKV